MRNLTAAGHLHKVCMSEHFMLRPTRQEMHIKYKIPDTVCTDQENSTQWLSPYVDHSLLCPIATGENTNVMHQSVMRHKKTPQIVQHIFILQRTHLVFRTFTLHYLSTKVSCIQ